MIAIQWNMSRILSAIFAYLLGTVAIASPVPTNIPPDVQLFNIATISDIPGVEFLKWPTSEQIERLRSDKRPSENTFFAPLRTLRTILNERWIPSDLVDRMLCLKQSINGNDAVYVRYACEGYNIQIVQTTATIGVTIQATNTTHSTEVSKFTAEDARKAIGTTIDQFFNESEKIKVVSLREIKATSYGFSGKSGFESPIVGSFMNWWGLVSWYTDGHTYAFIFGKPSRATPPVEKKEWF